MSYFTDDQPHKSSSQPLIVDNNNLPAEKIGFWEQNYWQQQATFATETPASKGYNIEEAVRDRREALEDLTGGDVEGTLKPFGYERPALTGQYYDPWEKTGHDAFEDAVKAYRDTLPNDKKARLFVRDEVKERAKQIALARRNEALEKLKGAQYGWWGGLLGEMTAHSRDGLFIMTQMLLPQAIFSKLAARGTQLSMKGRVAAAAGIDATAAVAYEIPAQKLAVQPYKQELGLDHTDQEVVNNIFAATIFSGIFGGTFEFAAGAFRKVATGEWTPQQAKQHFAENYDKLSPEQKEMVDMSLQAMEHERLNPYGPTEEGRAKFNEEAFEANQHAHSTGRKVTDQEVEQAQEAVALRDEEKEFLEIKESAEREAGVFDEPEVREEPEPLAQPELKDPSEAVRPYLSDEAQQLIDTAFPPQVRIQMADEIEAATGIRIQESQPLADGMEPELNKLFEDAARILPEEVKFELVDEIDGAYGSFESKVALMKVAKDAPDLGSTMRHEALHALRSRFKSSEWKTLVEASRKIEFKDHAAYVERAKEQFDTDTRAGTTAALDDINEEQVANLIEYAYKGGDISSLEPQPRNMLEKIVSWIKALAATLKKPEYNKLSTILDDFESGAIAQRSPRNRIPYNKEALYQMGANAQGSFDELENLVTLARNAVNQTETARHELIHALRANRLFTPNEWDTLLDAAQRGKWVDKHKIKDRYKDVYKGSKDDFEPVLIEEAIAEEFAKWRAGKAQVDEATQTIFEKIKNILERIVKVLKSSGTELSDDIFKKIESGEFRERGYSQAFEDVQMQTAVRQVLADGVTIKGEATDPIENLEIEVDGVAYRPKELMDAANDDLAMAENIKLCAMMGR